MPVEQVVEADPPVAEVDGERHALDDHRDRLGGAHRARRRLELDPAVLALAGAQLAEHLRRRGGSRRPARPSSGSDSAAPSAATRWVTIRTSSSAVAGVGQDDRVEAAAERARQLVDAPVAVVGGGDEVEARGGPAPRRRARGSGSVFSLSTVISASCTSLGIRVSSSMRTIEPRSIARNTGDGHERRVARTLGEQAGVVPAVAHRLLRRAGGALHEQRRVAADRRREVLADPRLRRAGQAEQQQRPVGGERGDRDLHQPARPDVLRRR